MTTLFGHDEQAQMLIAASQGDRMHHGWIFSGPQGIGKALFARKAALRLLADAAGPPVSGSYLNVSDEHPVARLFDAKAHPDYAELRCLEKEGGGVARNITVDQVRSLSRLIHSAPSMSNRRIVVIDAADDMERGAANALLKNLEEPPADMLFFLVSHSPGRLLPTIRSRCRVLRFNALNGEEMRSAIKAQNLTMAANEIDALIKVGAGSPGDALSFAGLDIAGLERSMQEIAIGGDKGNSLRTALAKSLSVKAAKPRYEAFLKRAPAFLANAAKQRKGPELCRALQYWEAARNLASGAVILSLDPATVVFELGSHIATLAETSLR